MKQRIFVLTALCLSMLLQVLSINADEPIIKFFFIMEILLIIK